VRQNLNCHVLIPLGKRNKVAANSYAKAI